MKSEKSSDEAFKGGSRPPPWQAWGACVTAVQQAMLKEHGVAEGRVVETEHPYPARSHSWNQTVRFENATSLKARSLKGASGI